MKTVCSSQVVGAPLYIVLSLDRPNGFESWPSKKKTQQNFIFDSVNIAKIALPHNARKFN